METYDGRGSFGNHVLKWNDNNSKMDFKQSNCRWVLFLGPREPEMKRGFPH
jgi:hypothetical protein